MCVEMIAGEVVGVKPRTLLHEWQFGIEVGGLGADPNIAFMGPVRFSTKENGISRWNTLHLERVYTDEEVTLWDRWVEEGRMRPRAVFINWYNRSGKLVRRVALLNATVAEYEMSPTGDSSNDKRAQQRVLIRYSHATPMPVG